MKLPRTREWRESRGLSQRELAALAGIGDVTPSRIEGGGSVNPPTARKVADALGVSVADLMESPPVPLGGAASASPEPVLSISLPSVADFDLETVEAKVIEVVRPQTRVELNEAIETLLANRYSESELLELRRNSLNRVDELTPEKEDHLDEYSRVVSTANLASRTLERIGAKDLA